MKRVSLFSITALVLCLFTGSAFAQLVGGTTYPINGTEAPPATFATINSAATYLAANGVTGTGQVILELSTGYAGEAGPVNINSIPGTSATLGVTFRPAAGTTWTTSIAGGASPWQFAFRLKSTNYVTFDGQAGGTSGTRDWTIICTGTNGQSAIRFYDSTGTGNTTNNVIRYCNLQAEATGTTSAIVAKTTGTTGNLFQNNIIEYNLIESGATIRGYAVSLGWTVSGQANTGNIIRYNHIRKFNDNGIRFTGTFPNTQIYGNEIYFTAAQVTATSLSAIYFTSTTSNNSGGVRIYSNKIYDLFTTTAAVTMRGFYQFGVNFTGDPMQFYNNYIALGNGATNNAIVRGIEDNTVAAGAPDYYYYNSIYIGGTVTAGAINSAAFVKAIGNPLMRCQNNVFYNARSNAGGTGTHWAISSNDSTTMGTIGYNDYFADGTGGVLGTVTGAAAGNKTTLAAWKAAVPADAGSVSQIPNYLNATASPPDLHINTTIATQLESGGTPVSGITTDLDGDARHASAPDISADEFAGIPLDLVGPGISYTALGNTHLTTSPRTLSPVTITDASLVDTTAGTRPRCYYKEISNLNVLPGTNDNTTDGWKYVEADGTGNSPFAFSIDYTRLYPTGAVTVYDTIQYFVTAQDLAGTPNVSINSGTFAAAPASAALTGAAFPIGGSIRNYSIIQPPMNGDYTVGLTKFNQATGRNLSTQTMTRKVTKTIEYLADQAAELDRNGQPIERPKQHTVTVDEQYQVLMENGKPYIGPMLAATKDGSRGVYTTLTAAIGDMNSRGIDGATRLLINDSALNEAGSMTIDITNSYTPTATNTVTIKPNAGVSTTVSVNSTSPVFVIAEPYVTIDGAAVGGTGNSRDLNLVNNGAGAASGVVFVSAVSNVTVKNVIGYTSASTVGYGLVWSARSFNGLAQNNQVYRTVIGIQAQLGSNGFTATGNSIGSAVAGYKIQNSGMVALDCTTFVFTGNAIAGISRAAGGSCAGIVVGNAAQTGTIANNEISDIKHTGTGANAYAAYGLRLSSSVTAANVSAYNNTITDILGDGDAGTTYTPHGILVSLGGGYNLYYNSVNMFGNINVAGVAPITSAIQVAAGVVNLDIRDNIFVNSQTCTNAGGKCYGIYSGAANTAYNYIDNNDYYAVGANGVLGFLGADQATLGAWQTATGKDVSSIGGNPLYLSNSDLRFSDVSPAYHAGTPIVGITTDFLGALRNVTTPSLGAYEEGVDVTPPTVVYTSPADGAWGVLVHAPVVIGFSEPMNPTTFTFLFPDPTVLWTDTIWNTAGDTVTLLHSNFSALSSFGMIINEADDLFGNTMVAAYPFGFTTSADSTPPTITGVSPALGATDVGLSEPIFIAFSEPMNTGSVDGYTVPFHDFTVSWNAAGDTFFLVPQNPYPYSTTLSVIITEGTDLAGYSLMSLPDTAVSFTTIANQGPVITLLEQPVNTFDGTGPFNVTALLTDPAKKQTKVGVASNQLFWQPSNDTIWQAVAATTTSGDTFGYVIPGPVAAGLTINAFVEAVDDAADTTYSNLIQFQIQSPMAPTGLLATTGQEASVPLAWNAPAESLYYYRGGSVFYYDLPATAMVSTRYTPNQYPFKINQIRSSWNSTAGNAPVRLRILGDDGNGYPDEATVLLDTTYTVTTGSWGDLMNISAKNLVIASGDFHVTWEILTSSQPRPRCNLGGVQQRSLYKWTDGLWYADLGGDWLNRVAVSYSNYTKGIALKKAPATNDDPRFAKVNTGAVKPVADNRIKMAANLPEFDLIKNIGDYQVYRSTVSGGPYGFVASTTGLTYNDNSVTNDTTYYYVVRATYTWTTHPDTFSAWSNEASATPLGVEGKPGVISYSFFLGTASPNPVKGSAEFRFGLARGQQANLGIYNVLGQKVKTLVNRDLPAGNHSVKWNGCDDNGRKVSSGVYVYRLSAGENTSTRRFTVIR